MQDQTYLGMMDIASHSRIGLTRTNNTIHLGNYALNEPDGLGM